jgi:3-hydroxyacyl-CoA dehydrogenase / enoyl-CoA hydratase / 3-hydroxybutyryl-CoA epimerase
VNEALAMLGEGVLEKMISLERPARLKGAGFYEYVDGKRTRLWPGLRETFKSGSANLPLQDMIDRMLFAEALETQKCLDEGVLTSTADANIGSIMGIGFPPHTASWLARLILVDIMGHHNATSSSSCVEPARGTPLVPRYDDRCELKNAEYLLQKSTHV